jgi:hypothetical protein
MKRILFFLLLGPPLGFGLLLSISLLTALPASSPPYTIRHIASGTLYLMQFVYLFGLPAATLAMFTDWILEKYPWRIIPVMAVGYLLALPILAKSDASLSIYLLFGFIGAIPAGICSWLSNPTKSVRHPASPS